MDAFVTRSKRKNEQPADDQTSCSKRSHKQTESKVKSVDAPQTIKFHEIRGENLNCDYTVLYSGREADQLLGECEKTLEYNTGDLARVHVFGRWHDIPRKQVAHGDPGLKYTFSGNTIPARAWTPLLQGIRDNIRRLTGHTFNFVLINRYKDGSDHIGEHRDDEKELVEGSPIASLSLGQTREFVFKHKDSRGKHPKRSIPPVKIELQHGSLLMMNYPTNKYWYHSLPPRKKLHNVRINMTFRQMAIQ